MKVIEKESAVLGLLMAIIVSHRVSIRLIDVLISLHKLVNYCSACWLIGVRGKFISVIYEVFPLHESVCAFNHLLFEKFVGLLVLSQLLFLLIIAN